MAEENVFFLPVRDYYCQNLITCNADDRVMDAAAIMRDRSISSIFVNENDEPVGILTDRDLRSKVVAAGLDPAEISAREIMNSPVISVNKNDTLFEVLYQMSHHRIHRVGVVDENNKLCGILNESDIVRLQNRSPQQLLKELEGAQTIEDLKSIHAGIEDLVVFLCQTGVKTSDLVRLISLLNDQTTLQLIHLLKKDRHPDLPAGCAFLVLGSEGRSEQTLKTDQDNALIYADNLTADEIAKVEAFSHDLIDSLIEIGVPECSGGIMAKNEFWRRNLSAWKQAIDSWVATPSGENILNFSMFSDMRTLWGDTTLEEELRAHIIKPSPEHTLFIARLAANVCRFVPPLGFFGGIKVEKGGENAGKIDLKKAGIFALTEGIKILALEQGVLGGSTHDKLDYLRENKLLPLEQINDLAASYNLLSFIRIRNQVDAIASNTEPSNFIAPNSLNRVEKGRLIVSLEVVKSFESTLKSHFQLSMVHD